MRVRITKPPPHETIDGVTLDHFWVGRWYDLSPSIGALLVAEGWAEAALPDEMGDDSERITADLLTKLSQRYRRPPSPERRIARFPIDSSAAVAHDWPDRRGRGGSGRRT